MPVPQLQESVEVPPASDVLKEIRKANQGGGAHNEPELFGQRATGEGAAAEDEEVDESAGERKPAVRDDKGKFVPKAKAAAPTKLKFDSEELEHAEIEARIKGFKEISSAAPEGTDPLQVTRLGSRVYTELQTREGAIRLRKELDDMIGEPGESAPAKGAGKQDEVALGEDDFKFPEEEDATPNEKALAAQLKRLFGGVRQVQQVVNETAGLTRAAKAELGAKIDSILGESQADKAAITAQKKVEAELGIQKTPAEIRQAMKNQGLTDPIKAAKLEWFDEIRGGAKKQGAAVRNGAPKPEELETLDERGIKIDPKNSSVAEIEETTRANPEILEGYIPPWRRRRQ